MQQGPWSVEGCRAPVPARVWSPLVIVSDWWQVGLRGVVFRDGPGGMLSWDGVGRVFVAMGASSRMVGGVHTSANGVGSSCFVLPSLRASCLLGGVRRAGVGRFCTPCRCPWVTALPS